MKIHNPFRSDAFCAALATLAAVFSLCAAPLKACSWDYTIWQVRSKNADPLFRFVRGEKAGYINAKGKIVVAPKLSYYGNGGAEFFDGLLLPGIAGGPYLDATGRVALDTKYDRNWDFSEGLAAALEKPDGKWGYIDRTGRFAIAPQFEGYPNGAVSSFSDGLAKIEVRKKIGYIDRTGKFAIEPRFADGASFSEGFARVVAEGPCVLPVDGPCGELRTVGAAGEGGAAAVTSFCRFAFVDRTGAPISNLRFENAYDFSGGLAAVKMNGKWGYIDARGGLAIAARFDDAASFADGLAAVKIGAKWGYIDARGGLAIAPRFDSAESFADGRAPVAEWNGRSRVSGGFFYIDRQGRPAFDGKFEQASTFFKGVAHVKLPQPGSDPDDYYMKGSYAYIDPRGRKIFTYRIESDDD